MRVISKKGRRSGRTASGYDMGDKSQQHWFVSMTGVLDLSMKGSGLRLHIRFLYLRGNYLLLPFRGF